MVDAPGPGNYMEALWHRRRIVAACTLSAMLIGGVFVFSKPPQYVAQALVLVAGSPLQVGGPAAGAGPQIGQSLNANLPTADFVAFTQSAAIRRRLEVLLPEAAGPLAARSLRLEASAIGSSTVELAVRGSNARLVAKVANLWASIAVQAGGSLFSTQATDAYRFFGSEWLTAKKELDSTEGALNDFNATHEVGLMGARLAALTGQITNYETALTDLSVQLGRAKASLAEINAQIRQQPKVVSLGKAITTDPVLLQTANEATRGSLKDLGAVRLTSEELNPVYIQLAEARATTSTLVASLEAQRSRTTQVLAQLTRELSVLQGQLVTAQRRQSDLARASSAAAKVYDVMLGRLTEARVATKGEGAPVRLMAGATEPNRPEPSRRLAPLALATLAGLLVGIIVALGMEALPGFKPVGVAGAIPAGE